MEFISFMILNFYNTLTSNNFTTPNFTDLFRITESILEKEKDNDKKIKEFLKDMETEYYNVRKTGISIPEMELIFFSNARKGFNVEIDINGKSYRLGNLFKLINEVIKDLTRYVSYVAYQYDVEMPLNTNRNTTFKM